MKILDPHLKDGVHEWRDGKRFVKEGVKYISRVQIPSLAGAFPAHFRRDPCQLLAASGSSPWTPTSAAFRISRGVLWVKRLNVAFNPARYLGIGNMKGTLSGCRRTRRLGHS